MTAPARRNDAATPTVSFRSGTATDLWRSAERVRQEWLDHGLSTQPADRMTAERCLTSIYTRIARPRPQFVWVDSPAKALPLLPGLPTLDELYQWIRDPRSSGPPPLGSDIATLTSRLRGTLSAGVLHSDPELTAARRPKSKDPWPNLPPSDALTAGVPLPVVLHRGVRVALHDSLVRGFCLPVRAALTSDGPAPVCWYGQQDASWIAYYDTLRRLDLSRHAPADANHLDDWAELARSCGWWWPGEQVCVVVERPARAHVEPVPGAWHGEVRLSRDGVEYRDGWHPVN